MTTADVITVASNVLPKDVAIISSLGRTSEEVYKIYPNQTLFLDSMGDVISIACGVSLGINNHPVVAIDTDGSHLMGMTILPTLSQLKRDLMNLTILVLDNGLYESGGMLPSRYVDLDWKLYGLTWGIDIVIVDNVNDLQKYLMLDFRGLRYIVAKIINTSEQEPVKKTKDGIESKYLFTRFIESVLNKDILKPSIKS